MPGGSLVADRLRRYRERHPSTEVSLVGHSAGTILMAALARRLAPIMPIQSMGFMGAALRADDFRDTVLPRIRSRRVKNFANFVLSDRRELDDKCDVNDVTFYHKSLLYLVSRGFERPEDNDDRRSAWSAWRVPLRSRWTGHRRPSPTRYGPQEVPWSYRPRAVRPGTTLAPPVTDPSTKTGQR